MTRHPHRPDRIAAGIYLAAFTAAVAITLALNGAI